MLTILSITGPIFLLIALGFNAVRFGAMDKGEMRALGKLVIGFALPALLFRSLSQRSLAEIANPSYMLAYAAGSLAVMAAATLFARLVQKKPLQVSALYAVGMCCSNSGFVGYPILLQTLGHDAAVALALNMTVENVVLLPVLLVLLEGGAKGGESLASVLAKTARRLATNPMILAIAAGLGFSLTGLRLPDPVFRAVDMLAMASGAVALFAIGGTLVGLKVRGMVGDVAQIAAGKLILHPLAVGVAMALLPPMEPAFQAGLILSASVPMMSIYPLFGQRCGQEALCAAALVTATIASFVTISLILWGLGARGLLPLP
ncbi:putative permease [Azospirillum fermentarium]|uniref:AEC family transporter n=1 Tax=Azospirillum fermentarium TaxID=1233114 RepID=UPI002226A379|nr:AEC family transporter [Azospirillum fermentarium]MCW2248705.1 putative permease [Azospirillum fermentarium]